MTPASPPLFGLGPDVQRTVGWVSIGYRIAAVIWVAALVLGTFAGADVVPRPGVVVVAMAVIVVWNVVLVTAWTRSRSVIRNPIVLAIDISVAVCSFFVPFWSGNGAILFRGGYPFSAVVLAIHARGRWVGAAAGAAMLVAAIVRRALLDLSLSVGPVISEFLSWAFPTVLFIWAYEVVLSADAGRREADAALARAQAERARAEERSAMATHLHDSVLQTLALIQRDAGNAEEVQALARTQERELRAWLQGSTGDARTSVRRALEDACAELEDRYRIRVELVVVGDAAVTGATNAIVAAMREAVVNAAKHAEVAEVDVFAEASDDAVVVFVRDRGVGFDVSAVEGDRIGIRESIVGRVERHGGTVEVRSAPSQGTEVRMEVSTA